LEERVGRPAATILRTIGGFKVYHGIKPVKGKGRRRPLSSSSPLRSS
jgi:hypothetical protein